MPDSTPDRPRLEDIPKRPREDMSIQAWRTAYQLCALGANKQPDVEIVADLYYPLVVTAVKNTGIPATELGDQIAAGAAVMKRFGRKRGQKIAYLLGAASTVQFRDLCSQLRDAGEKPENAMAAMVVMADRNNPGLIDKVKELLK